MKGRIPFRHLMILVAVVATMIAILVYVCQSIQYEELIHEPREDMTPLAQALGVYKERIGRYPTTEQGLIALVERPTIDPKPEKWLQIYNYLPIDPWGRPYEYKLEGDHFILWSKGKSVESSEDDIYHK